ncbi:M43 family zinc metalloprotease [Rhodonellum sp.]|uniref:M43 family zinc metalloprotease n=1 Tax=Rhodonellum sp. TaxID=2231180 RepID=UPI00272710C4|nr:M43 family zinc metalloprotease [Rhodonellum sp.]MDO9553249.1 M43 family zinc metalloprotease [Rhodonellum sp.]
MKRIFLTLRMGLVLSFLFILPIRNTFSQNFFGKAIEHQHDEKCGALHLEKMQEELLGIYGSRDYFEAWMNGKMQEIKRRPAAQFKTQNGPRIIPVVVHVIHNGTAIGEGANIPEAQIQSQIRTLTEDFRRQNPDIGSTPSEFLGVAADAQIEFVLAKQDPRGLPTSGIMRVQGPKSTYSPSDAGLIGQLALWPPDEYLNIWVVPLTSPFIGFASFPISELPGLNFPSNPAETDGVTIDYRYFGEGNNAVSGSRGRTATHEVGHFFGLRHIWGDGDCSVDDFVADTPLQGSPNNSCRLDNPRFSCDRRDMAENYMDYTPDACMNIFTVGQVARMNVVLEFSPRRSSLVNNRATIVPQLVSNDLGFERIINPQDFICTNQITPQIQVFNSGTNPITTTQVEIKNNGVVLETRTFSVNLTTGESTILTFNPITLNPTGSNEFESNILFVNNTIDNNPSNNRITSTPSLQTVVSLPYSYIPADFNTKWVIDNPDSGITWEQRNMNISGVTQNAIMIRHYEYDGAGELDYFISPQLDLSAFPNAQLTFNLAHAPYEANGFGDALMIAVSTDCGNTFDILNPPYNKGRDFLETSAPTLDEFVPVSENQFRREIVNLAKFSDFGNVRIAFISRNGYGNNIYIKDIEILSQETFRYAVRINELVEPQPITNGEHRQETLSITNTGNLPVSGFMFTRRTNNNSPQSFLARGLALPAGGTTNINLPKSTSMGMNSLGYALTAPNFDQNDRDPSTLLRYVVQNTESTRAPWRQNFDNATSIGPWVTVNPENNFEAWDLAALQVGSTGSNVARIDAQQALNSYWLGSPTFDLSISSQASVFFDRASGPVSAGTVFKLLASKDGGVTYQEVYRKTGNEISTVQTGLVNPNSSTDYIRDYVNLTAFAGKGNEKSRLAFVLEGGEETNSTLYLNNVELFLAANEEPVNPGLGNTVIYPNPAREIFNIAFNLETFEMVNIQIFSATGALVQDIDYPNTLNQTYSFSSQLFSKGLFVVKITSRSITETRRLILY